ncbi:ribonuclease H-like domain-containing protein [Tanacetum coccineum]
MGSNPPSFVEFNNVELVIVGIKSLLEVTAAQSSDTSSFEEVMRDVNWINDMNDEMHTLYENDTLCLADLPASREPIGTRLVAKDYSKKEGVSYEETFSHVVKMGTLNEDVYMLPPPGFFKSSENNVCKLKKSLYGFKRVPRQWNHKMSESLSKAGFVQPMMTPVPKNIVFTHKDYEDDKYLIAANFVMHEKTKNFDIDVHLVREKVSFGLIRTIKLKDTIMVAMPKLVGEGFYMCTIRVEYEWKPPRCLSCKVGLKVGFKLVKQVYRHVFNKNGANLSGNKKQAKVSRQEVSNSNQFDALLSVENDDDLEQQILDGKLMFVDDDGKPLYKADSTGIADSDSEVEKVYNKTAGFMASTGLKRGSKSGYGTNSLLEQ